MDISSFDDLLHAARLQPEPQRLLFVFVGVELPDDATPAQRARPRQRTRKTPPSISSARLIPGPDFTPTTAPPMPETKAVTKPMAISPIPSPVRPARAFQRSSTVAPSMVGMAR